MPSGDMKAMQARHDLADRAEVENTCGTRPCAVRAANRIIWFIILSLFVVYVSLKAYSLLIALIFYYAGLQIDLFLG